jgi:hypothetical protein
MDDIKLHPYAAALLKFLKNKEVEINCGDIKTVVKLAEQDVSQKHVIRGILKDACGDALIVLVLKNNKYANVFINVWSIKSVVPMEDSLFIKDIYEEEHYGFAK